MNTKKIKMLLVLGFAIITAVLTIIFGKDNFKITIDFVELFK